MKKCPECAAKISELNVFKLKAGSDVVCEFCGDVIEGGKKGGPFTDEKQQTTPPTPVVQEVKETAKADSGLSKREAETYLADESLIERYPKGKWNWWAFLFGGIYYCYKGVWGKGIIFLVAALTIDYFTDGWGGVLVGIYAGKKFNEHYLEEEGLI